MVKANLHLSDIKPYVPGKPIDSVKRELGLETVIKLASNENNWGIPKRVKERLVSVLDELYLYPDGSMFRLREKLSSKLNIHRDQLVFGNGSDELLQLIGLAFLGPQREALISSGTFSEYEFSCRIVNAPFRVVNLNADHTYDLPAFAKAVSPQTNVVFLCNPNNPTGTSFSERELIHFMDSVSEEILVVLDEAYCEFAKGEDYPDSIPLLKRYPNLIILRTFSKLWSAAGLRLGYGIASAQIIACLEKVRQPFNVNRMAEEMGLAMLEEVAWEESVREKVVTQRERMQQELQQMGLTVLPSCTNFLFFFTPTSGKDVFEKLLKKGIIVRAMDGFGFSKAIRVTVGLPEENEAFIKALQEVL